MIESNMLIEYGKFILKELGIETQEDFDWNNLIMKYEKLKFQENYNSTKSRPGLMYINWVVARFYNLDSLIVKDTNTKKRQLVKARQVGQYISNVIYKYTTIEIAEFYNKKNHSTIIFSRKSVENEMETNKEFKAEVEEILSIFSNLTNEISK